MKALIVITNGLNDDAKWDTFFKGDMVWVHTFYSNNLKKPSASNVASIFHGFFGSELLKMP